MSDDRTVEAALAIKHYVEGLQAELALLGAVESEDLATEVRDMLQDAAWADPARAFDEMARLGEPSQLAATLLAERGIAPGGGIPSASWVRLGAAASIDIFVGFALPAAALMAVYSNFWDYLVDPAGTEFGLLQFGVFCLFLALLGVAGSLAWTFWSPWRTGDGRATPGMTLAQVAVVRIGGARAVVRSTDLQGLGLETPRRSMLSATATVLLAAVAIGWGVWMVSTGALDPTGEGAVYRFAGPVSVQRERVLKAVDELYAAAVVPMSRYAVWPAIEDKRLDPEKIKASLHDQFAAAAGRKPGGALYDAIPSNDAPGVWQVGVTELPGTAAEREVILFYGLRVDWTSADTGGYASRRQATWVLIGYDWMPTP